MGETIVMVISGVTITVPLVVGTLAAMLSGAAE